MLHQRTTPFKTLVDAEKGLVDRVIFSDQAIYELELERIFARAWNFMCHESQIPKAGDFFLSFIGEESVIATRDKKGELQVLLNSCRHRGNAVCRAEEGNARSFLCTYHGWTYGLDGSLIGVPGYKGFVFATMDHEAPDLDEYLGPVGRMSIDLIATRAQLKHVHGVQKSVIGCNWKLAVDNLFDYYHVGISHASAMMSNYRQRNVGETGGARKFDYSKQRVILGKFGHAIGGPRFDSDSIATTEPDPFPGQDETWRRRPDAKAIMGEAGIEVFGHPNIFPNLWVTESGQLSLRIPRGPKATEIWWFSFEPTDVTPEQHREVLNWANRTFGPAGLLEQDDGENWDQSTRQTSGVVARRYPLNFSMDIGRNNVITPADGGPAYVDTRTNEHAQLWTYRAWADWMDADNWASLKSNSTELPSDKL